MLCQQYFLRVAVLAMRKNRKVFARFCGRDGLPIYEQTGGIEMQLQAAYNDG